eukprot:scaffold2600_cov238-Pinguiococcus_pyrenoidosus.AAC.2
MEASKGVSATSGKSAPSGSWPFCSSQVALMGYCELSIPALICTDPVVLTLFEKLVRMVTDGDRELATWTSQEVSVRDIPGAEDNKSIVSVTSQPGMADTLRKASLAEAFRLDLQLDSIARLAASAWTNVGVVAAACVDDVHAVLENDEIGIAIAFKRADRDAAAGNATCQRQRLRLEGDARSRLGCGGFLPLGGHGLEDDFIRAIGLKTRVRVHH